MSIPQHTAPVAPEELLTPARTSARIGFPAVLAPDDETLIARMAKGDKRAMGPFYARWEQSVRSAMFLKPADAMNTADVVEEIFWRAWCQARSFDTESASAESWLLGITLEVCLDRCRKAVRGDDRYGAW